MQQLRKNMLALRREFAKTPRYREASEKICGLLSELEEFKRAKNVMLYLPLVGEVDVRGIYCPEKRFCVPVTRGVIISPAAYWPNMEMKKGEYGVTEPKDPIYIGKDEIELVVVPAVAADLDKNRMGFGKGCYDRFLSGMDAIKVAVCFDFQLTRLTAGAHDVKPDYIITESGCF